MACFINFQMEGSIKHYFLCDAGGKLIAFKECDPGWDWFNTNRDAFDFNFPAGRNVRNYCLTRKTRDVYADIANVVGTNWDTCRLKPGVTIPSDILA